MILIIDANTLFSSLIKNSATAKLIFEEDLKLYSPDYVIVEFFKYQNLILKKTHRTKDEFIQIMHILNDIITVLPKEEYLTYITEAKEISPDPKDVMYFALALKLDCGIWSNDGKLKTQDKVKVYNTKDLLKIYKRI